MVLDVDKLTRSETGDSTDDSMTWEGILWVMEQIPGATESADVSKQLLEQGYWASFNVP